MNYLPCGTPDSTFLELKKKKKRKNYLKKETKKQK